MIKPRNVLPLTLKPGEYILEYTSDLSVLDKNLKKLWALDSRNRKFKASWKQVRSLKKEFLAGVLSKKS